MISIDSFGWIERFTKRPKTREYGQLIESTPSRETVTSVVVLYEVYKKIKKMKGEEEALLAIASISQTNIVPIDQSISLEAADYSLEHGLHFSDTLVYATARHWKAKLYASDEDLKALKDVNIV